MKGFNKPASDEELLNKILIPNTLSMIKDLLHLFVSVIEGHVIRCLGHLAEFLLVVVLALCTLPPRFHNVYVDMEYSWSTYIFNSLAFIVTVVYSYFFGYY